MDFFRSTFGVKQRSWPAFWVGGFIVGLLFAIMGPASVAINIKHGNADKGAVFVGIYG